MGTFPTLWDLHPDVRLGVMRRMISAPPGWRFRPYAEGSGRWKGTPGFGGFPLKWKHDAERLCAFHGCLFRFRTLPSGSSPGGAFHAGNGTGRDPRTVLVDVVADDKFGQERHPFLSTWEFVTTLSHELGHVFQWKFYGHPGRHIPGYGKLLSDQVAFEREACRLAFHVWKSLMSNVVPDLTFKDFDDYRTKKSFRTLLENWPGMVDDVTFKKSRKPGLGR